MMHTFYIGLRLRILEVDGGRQLTSLVVVVSMKMITYLIETHSFLSNGSKMADVEVELDDSDEGETEETVANGGDYVTSEIARTSENLSTKFRLVRN